MQTFLPYEDFNASARSLDNIRLPCQIKEAFQVMQGLLLHRGWVHHPVVHMWREHEWELLLYTDAMNAEWMSRGHREHGGFTRSENLFFRYLEPWIPDGPDWLGNTDFHRAHQSNLVRKDPDYYGPQFPGVPDDLPYIYPGPHLEGRFEGWQTRRRSRS